MSSTISALPLYPSTSSLSVLSPTQRAALSDTILSTLSNTLVLPAKIRDTKSSLEFLESYARNTAREDLQSLIWGVQDGRDGTKVEAGGTKLKGKVLALAEKLVVSPNPDARPSLQILLDLCVVFSAYPSRIRSLLSSALSASSSLAHNVSEEAVPAFTTLLSPGYSGGLYGLRKTAHMLECFVRCSPADLIKPFATNKQLVVTLARSYDEGLASIARSYGGFGNLSSSADVDSGQLDDWEVHYVRTKRSLLDTFHIILSCLLASLSPSCPTTETVNALEILSSLVQLTSSPAPSSTLIPFLNRPLLTDYFSIDSQRLSRTLVSLNRTEDKQWDALEASIRSLEQQNDKSESAKQSEMVKLLLRSSGMPRLGQATSNQMHVQAPSPTQAASKGKSRAIPFEPDLDVDLQVTQVLDILSDQDPSYISLLLKDGMSVEAVIAGILEGTVPTPEDMQEKTEVRIHTAREKDEEAQRYVMERRNVFDGERIDEARAWVGKSRDDKTLSKDPYLAQMKADILRRVEEMSSDEEDGAANVAFEDEELDGVAVKVGGDEEDGEGPSSSEEGTDDEGEGTGGNQTPMDAEEVVERAYMRDPTLFERDAKTKRGEARARLKAETRWTDEQIEGWRIMLERDPKGKQKLLQKYEFAGNRNNTPGPSTSSAGEDASGGRGRGRGGRGGRGGGGRGGGGRGGGGRGAASGGGSSRDRSQKERRGNVNRKRGHDRKVARGGAGV